MSEKLPEGWKIATLEDIARVTSGGTPSRKKSSYWNGCIPWVTTGEILFNTITQTNEYITELGMLNSSAKIFPEGTLLIAMYGQGKTRGSVARLGISAATNQACAVILLSDSQDSYFHFYNFQNKYNNIRNISNTSSQKNLSLELIKKQKIIFPPIFEQKKIAHILLTWDDAIHHTQNFLENSKTQKKALMQQLLTGRRRLPGFSNPWSAAPLNTLFREIKRPVIWDDNKEYKLLSVKRRAGGVFFRENIFGKEIKTKKLNSVCSDELLISKMQVVHGSIGIVQKYFDGCFVSDSYIILAPKNKNKLLMKFIGYYFQQPHIWHLAYLNSHGVHIEKMTFNFDSFLKETIEIPSDIAEQKAIADVLTAADAVIQQYEAKLANLQAQKKALMQQLLTGKIRVRTDTDAAQHQPA